MKKIVLFVVAAVAVSFASCGGNASKEAETVVEEQVEEVVATVDSAAITVDSLATVADSTVVAQ